MIDDEGFDDLMELVVHGFEIAGVAVVVLAASTGRSARVTPPSPEGQPTVAASTIRLR